MPFSPLSPECLPARMPIRRVRAGWVAQLAWSPRGDLLAVAGGEGLLLYHGGFGGAPNSIVPSPDAPLRALAFQPAGASIAAGSADSSVKLWQLGAAGNLQQAASWYGHGDAVTALAFDRSGQILASGAADGTVCLWDCTQGKLLRTWAGHDAEVSAVVFAADGLLITASHDRRIQAWDLHADGAPRELGRCEARIRGIALQPQTGQLLAASSDGMISCWRLDGAAVPTRFHAHANGVDSLSFSPDGRLLASGGRDHAVRLWDSRSWLPLCSLQSHRKPVLSLAFHPAGRLLVSASGDHSLRLWAAAAIAPAAQSR